MRAWQDTQVTRILDLKLPLIQGPFGGGLSSAALVAAVAEAGGLGSFGVHHLAGADILAVARDIRRLTPRPFALNLWIPKDQSESPNLSDPEFEDACAALAPYYQELEIPLPQRPTSFWPAFPEQMEAVIEARPRVFSFVYGVPSPDILRECRAREILTLGAATTVAEALALEQAGVDLIVATGFEAGGHRVSFLEAPEDCLTGTFALIPQVVDAVKVPVIAAGGIADGRGIAAAMMLGAQAVQIGTAFLACQESACSEPHRRALFSPAARRTGLTRAFSGRLARGIRNRLMDDLRERNPPDYPVQTWLTGPLKQAANQHDRPDLLALWAGQAAPLLKHKSAAELIGNLVAETDRLLTHS